MVVSHRQTLRHLLLSSYSLSSLPAISPSLSKLSLSPQVRSIFLSLFLSSTFTHSLVTLCVSLSKQPNVVLFLRSDHSPTPSQTTVRIHFQFSFYLWIHRNCSMCDCVIVAFNAIITLYYWFDSFSVFWFWFIEIFMCDFQEHCFHCFIQSVAQLGIWILNSLLLLSIQVEFFSLFFYFLCYFPLIVIYLFIYLIIYVCWYEKHGSFIN